MGFESPSHWLIVIVVVAALFGYKRLPDMSRSVARSHRIFKTEMKGMASDDAVRDNHHVQTDGAHGSVPGGASPYGANPYAATPPIPAAAPTPSVPPGSAQPTESAPPPD